MRCVSPPRVRGLVRALPGGERLLFALLFCVSFLFGFSVGEDPSNGPRPVEVSSVSSLEPPGPGPLVLTAFFDYGTPFSVPAQRVLENLDRVYGDRVEIRIRLLPARRESWAWQAHCAAAAAEAQGKLWSMQAKLIAASGLGSSAGRTPPYLRFATELGLDVVEFERAMAAPAIAQRIALDRSLARSYGVTRAPALVVAGQRIRRLEGLLHYEVVRKVLDRELARQESRSL